MKLNLAKCAFVGSGGEVLGFYGKSKGVETNPDKIQALVDMAPFRTKKKIQGLADRVVTLI